MTEAARLRKEYGVQTGGQRGPYFDLQAERFALSIVVDTGVLRTVDADQPSGPRAALERPAASSLWSCSGIRSTWPAATRATSPRISPPSTACLKNTTCPWSRGGRHARPSSSTARIPWATGMLDAPLRQRSARVSEYRQSPWPGPAPRRCPDCVIRGPTLRRAKLDRETPAWKQPIWFWVSGCAPGHRPPNSWRELSTSTGVTRVLPKSASRARPTRVVLIPHGVNGLPAGRDMQCFGQIIPAHKITGY